MSEDKQTSSKKPKVALIELIATLEQRILATIIDGLIIDLIFIIVLLIPTILQIIAIINMNLILELVSTIAWSTFVPLAVLISFFYFVYWPAVSSTPNRVFGLHFLLGAKGASEPFVSFNFFYGVAGLMAALSFFLPVPFWGKTKSTTDIITMDVVLALVATFAVGYFMQKILDEFSLTQLVEVKVRIYLFAGPQDPLLPEGIQVIDIDIDDTTAIVTT